MADARSGVPVADSPICNIGGGRVALGPIMRPHLPAMQRWFSDPDTLLTAGIGVMPWTMERLTTWYEGRTSDDDAVWFTVYSLPDYRQIGFAGLRDIDYQSRSAEYAITIGEADARGQGYGTEVTRLIVSYAFDELGLESIGLDTVEYNHGARRAYEKAGFREIGRRKRAEAVGGRLWDAVLMECVKLGEPQSPVRVPVPGEGRQRAAAAGEPVLFIVGERIGLGPASRSQLPIVAKSVAGRGPGWVPRCVWRWRRSSAHGVHSIVTPTRAASRSSISLKSEQLREHMCRWRIAALTRHGAARAHSRCLRTARQR
jgi:RimJ/RimL family protein N-acetyltransferase